MTFLILDSWFFIFDFEAFNCVKKTYSKNDYGLDLYIVLLFIFRNLNSYLFLILLISQESGMKVKSWIRIEGVLIITPNSNSMTANFTHLKPLLK